MKDEEALRHDDAEHPIAEQATLQTLIASQDLQPHDVLIDYKVQPS